MTKKDIISRIAGELDRSKLGTKAIGQKTLDTITRAPPDLE